jgi:hypothetical protein
MKRRTFILTAAAVATIVAIPVVKYSCRHTMTHDPLVRPDVLARFCDEETIREIGMRYRSQVPGENKKEKLVELLLTDDTGKKITPSSDSVVSDWIEQKIQQEFKTERMVTVAGWILSQTEARQCALLSFSEN